MPLVSVVIPARNEQEHIASALEAMLRQSHSNSEIIVVNDGSTDSTQKIVEKYVKKNKRITLFTFPQGHSAAFARNFGARKARGEILVFFDADCTAGKDYLQKIAENFAKLGLDGVSNKTLAAPAKSFIGKCVAAQRALLWDTRQKQKVEFDAGTPTLIASFKKNVFQKLGGYKEKIFYFEDADLTQRFLQAGFKAVYEPSAVVFHSDPATLEETLRQARWFGRGIASNFLAKGEWRPLLVPVYSLLTTATWLSLALSALFLNSSTTGLLASLSLLLLAPALAYGLRMARTSGDFVHSLGFLPFFFLRNDAKMLAALKTLFSKK